MKILFVSAHLPAPGLSGGRQREYELIKRLSRKNEFVGIFVCQERQSDAERLERLKETYERCHLLEASNTPLAKHPYAPKPYYRNAVQPARDAILRELDYFRPQVIHVEGYYMMQLLPEHHNSRLLLVNQNIEHSIALQKHQLAASTEESDRLLREYDFVLGAESRAWRQADMNGFVTDDDLNYFMENFASGPARLSPNGVHAADLGRPTKRDGETASILMVANFGYEPSHDAAITFCREIIPRIREALPKCEIKLVGNGPRQELLDAAQQVGAIVTGRVSDLTDHYVNADVFVCPLRLGGGIKMKMLEALQHGCAIVSSPVGVQGLDWRKGGIIVEQNSDEFASAVCNVLRNPQLKQEMRERSRRYRYLLPTWDQASTRMQGIYEELSSG